MEDRNSCGPNAPSSWVARWLPLAAPGARALDLAAGGGRHAQLAASRGYRVTAVDRQVDALRKLDVDVVECDLETGAPFIDPPLDQTFDVVIVTNYLHRPLMSAIAAAVAPGGRLIYETFMSGQQNYGRPTNPDFLLEPGELLGFAADGLEIAAYEAGLADPPAMRQRLCALRPPAAAPVTL